MTFWNVFRVFLFLQFVVLDQVEYLAHGQRLMWVDDAHELLLGQGLVQFQVTNPLLDGEVAGQ